MLTLAQPAALWLLFALLALLLVRRLRPRRQQLVGTLHLWAGLEQAQQPAISRRIRRHQSTVLQAAFIVLVVFALAKPQLAISRYDVAMVIDASMSMGATTKGRRRLDDAISQARVLARSLPSRSRIALYVAGPDVEPAGTFAGVAALEDRFASIHVSDAAANLDVAIERARSADTRPARIYVFSDSTPAATASDIEWVGVGTAADNVAVTALAASAGSDDETLSVLVGVTSFGSTDAVSDVVVRHEDTTIARMTLSIPAGGSSSGVVQVPRIAGVISAHLEKPDALAADNTRFAIVPANKPIAAQVIGDRSPFLDEAFSAMPDVEVMLPSGEAPDLVICTGCNGLPAEHTRAGVLLLPSGTPSSAGLAPVVLAAADHPLLSGVDASGTLVLPIESAVTVDPSGVLMRAGGHPVVSAYDAGARRVVDLRFDPSRSPLAAQPAFPLLIAASVAWLSGTGPTTTTAGDPLVVQAEDVRSATDPAGQSIAFRSSSGLVTVDRTFAAGIYRFSTAAGDIPRAVNPNVAAESDLASGNAPTLAASAPAAATPVRSPVDFTAVLLLVALAVLTGEWHSRTRGGA